MGNGRMGNGRLSPPPFPLAASNLEKHAMARRRHVLVGSSVTRSGTSLVLLVVWEVLHVTPVARTSTAAAPPAAASAVVIVVVVVASAAAAAADF